MYECGTYVCETTGTLVCEDLGENACRVINFIVMGDTGEANAAQYQVAEGAQRRCDRAGGCEGFLMLGDNIYDTGAESPDEQLTTKIDLCRVEKRTSSTNGVDDREDYPSLLP